MNPGAELAEARRQLGLSLEELSARTKISVERLCAIEDMDALRLPSLVYLKGFLRAYAAEVRLDPEQTTNRYLAKLDVVASSAHGDRSILDQFETETPRPRQQGGGGQREIVPAGPVAPSAAPHVDDAQTEADLAPDESAASPAATAPLTARGKPRDLDPPLQMIAGISEVGVDAPLQASGAASGDHASERVAGPRLFGTYDPPGDAHSVVRRKAPVRTAAMLLTLGVALAAGWLIGQNYDAIADRLLGDDRNRGTAEDTRDERERSAPAGKRSAGGGAGRSEGPKATETTPAPARESARTLESAGTPASPDPPRSGAKDASRKTGAPAAAQAITPLPVRSTRPSPDRASAAAGSRVQPDARNADGTVEASPGVEVVPAPNTGDLTGSWTLTNRIETSSYAPFNGMNVGFQLQLRQEGNRVTGTGRKWMENGRPLPAGGRTPIAVEGTIEDGKLRLNFTERGAERESAGTFVLEVTDEGTLSGTFSSDAANAQGTSLARRQAPRR